MPGVDIEVAACRRQLLFQLRRKGPVARLPRGPDHRRQHRGIVPEHVCRFVDRHGLAARSSLVERKGELVFTSEDGVLARLAANETPSRYLAGGNAAWQAAGLKLSTEGHMADEPLDVWLKPYERAGDTKSAMSEYLSWETDLLPRIARDGTTRFMGV